MGKTTIHIRGNTYFTCLNIYYFELDFVT